MARPNRTGRPKSQLAPEDAAAIRKALARVERLESELRSARLAAPEAMRGAVEHGTSMRVIAEELGISHQRIHQLVRSGH
jgi:hypothetical protein